MSAIEAVGQCPLQNELSEPPTAEELGMLNLSDRARDITLELSNGVE